MQYFTQEAKDQGEKMLDALIKMTEAAAVEACNDGGLDHQRNQLYSGLSALYEAKSILGGIEGPEISTRSGGGK